MKTQIEALGERISKGRKELDRMTQELEDASKELDGYNSVALANEIHLLGEFTPLEFILFGRCLNPVIARSRKFQDRIRKKQKHIRQLQTKIEEAKTEMEQYEREYATALEVYELVAWTTLMLSEVDAA